MEIRYFDIPGDISPIPCKLSYEEGFSKLIIGVHGFAGNMNVAILSAVAETMAPEYALLSFDLPAHGSSPTTDEQLTVENCVNCLVSVYRWAEKTYPQCPLYMFGISFGGYTTVLALGRHLIQPEKVVLQAPALEMDKIFRERLPKEVFESFERTKVLDFGFERKMKVPFAYYEELLTIPIMESDIDVPTLILSGSEDLLVHAPMLHAFADDRDTVSIVDIVGAAHSLEGKYLEEGMTHTAKWFRA